MEIEPFNPDDKFKSILIMYEEYLKELCSMFGLSKEQIYGKNK